MSGIYGACIASRLLIDPCPAAGAVVNCYFPCKYSVPADLLSLLEAPPVSCGLARCCKYNLSHIRMI
jgi:hypothetical protein